MEPKPLEYATPPRERPYYKPAFYSLIVAVVQWPIEALIVRLPVSGPGWMLLLPWGLATAYGLRTWWWLELRRHRYKGLWIAGVALLIDMVLLLCLL